MHVYQQTGNYPCACCSHYTIEVPGHSEICPVCFWQDDQHQAEQPDEACGPNTVSLHQAQLNYRLLGAMEAPFLGYVRPPLPAELPQAN